MKHVDQVGRHDGADVRTLEGVDQPWTPSFWVPLSDMSILLALGI
jgi:hypothetical protein